MKISLKLWIIISAFTVIPLVGVGFISYYIVGQVITQNIFSKLDAIAQIQKNRLLNNMSNDTDLLNMFTSKFQLRTDVAAYDVAPTSDLQKKINDNISQEIVSPTSIKEISIANPAGLVIASTDTSFIGQNVSSDDYFKIGIKQDEVYIIKRDDISGVVERYLVGPLSLQGKTTGVAILESSDEDLNSLVNDYTDLGNSGETLLVKNDGNGNAIFLTPIRFDKNAALTRSVPKGRTDIASIRAINREEATFANLVDYRNVPVFAATRYISSAGWGIVVKIDKSEALAPLIAIRHIFLIVLLIVIFLVAVFSSVASISFTKSVRKLSSISEKIAAGDLSQNIEIRSKDEIGNLSSALKHMISSLRESTERYKKLSSRLEDEVKAQTAQLENQNTFLSQTNKAMVNLSEDLEKERGELKVAKTNIDAMIASMGDAIVAVDDKGLITIVNDAAEKLFGYKSSEIVSKSVFDVVLLVDDKEALIPKEKRPLAVAFSEKKIVNALYRCVRKDKSEFIAAITSAPVILEGKVIGAVDVFRDVTKEREIDKAKTEFVSLASHQLRTPATAVKWYSEMLLDKKMGKLNAKQQRYLDEVYHGNERMIKLIDNLLSTSRIELGKLSPKIESVDAKELMKNIINEQNSEIIKRKHKLIVDQPAGPVQLSTDSSLLRMIMQNLISNAIKYTHNKGKIVCTLKKEDSKVLFSVKDNGVGIPKEEQKRIFEKLFRATNSLELDKEGNGLGLYIVKQVAATLGGKVRFESELGKGTAFHLELPLKI